MSTKLFRWALLVAIIGMSIRIGRSVYSTIFQLVEFHIALYKYLLQGQEFVWSVGSRAQETMQWLLSRLSENTPQPDLDQSATESLQERLDGYTKKVHIVCGLIWVVVGSRCYVVMTRIAFKAKEHIQALKNFVN